MIPWHVFIFLSLAHAEINLGSVQNSSVQSTDSTPIEATNATELKPCHLSGSAASYCECSKPGEQNLLMIKCFIDQKFDIIPINNKIRPNTRIISRIFNREATIFTESHGNTSDKYHHYSISQQKTELPQTWKRNQTKYISSWLIT